MLRTFALLGLSLALAVSSQAQTNQTARQFLISASELAAQLQDPAVVVLHIADRESSFADGHIPGARFVRYGDFAVEGDTGVGSELPPAAFCRARSSTRR